MNLAQGKIKVHLAAACRVLRVDSCLDAARRAHVPGLVTLVREGRHGT